MSSFARRCIDPTPEEVRRLFAEVLRRAAEALPPGAAARTDDVSADELCSCAAGRAEGAYARGYSVAPGYASVVVGAAWWTDPHGRKHWYVEGGFAQWW